MTPDQIDLARRAVACKGWRWLPGMLAWRTTHRGERVQVRIIDGMDRHAELADPRQAETTPSGSSLLASGHSVVDGWHRVEDLTPDLSDPATLGCLLALVRKAWRCPTVYVRQSTSRRVSDGAFAWEVCDLWVDAEACRALGVDRQGSVGSWGAGSEAEALVDALEAAP